jgi:predicted MPP superfamily phosphohydrolase
MTKLTLLHLSDLHWTSKKGPDQKIVLDALMKDLSINKNENGLAPDLIMFSGDLVQAGQDETAFEEAKREFTDRVLAATGLKADRLLLVPGNHDIMREVVRDAEFIESGLRSTLSTVDKLNHFIDDISKAGSKSAYALDRMKNFDSAIPTISQAMPLSSSSLMRTYSFSIDETNVGVACFNTARRSTGEDDDRDRRNMLLGERNVDNALRDLQDSEIRIAMFHHPFDWLAEFDETAVSSRLVSQFDIVMCGHIHRSFPEARTTSAGTAIISQSGCLYHSRKYFNGYQYVILDVDQRSAKSW